jgi:hypothetical protein
MNATNPILRPPSTRAANSCSTTAGAMRRSHRSTPCRILNNRSRPDCDHGAHPGCVLECADCLSQARDRVGAQRAGGIDYRRYISLRGWNIGEGAIAAPGSAGTVIARNTAWHVCR